MKWSEWFGNWSMTSLKVKSSFLEMDFLPNDSDKNAAWELYVDLITRVVTQGLPVKDGDEKAALNSIYNIFELTRDNLKRNGRHCGEFTKISILVLNQIIRPFTSKWHPIFVRELSVEQKIEFRVELEALRLAMTSYSKMLADMSDVEDLTTL
jgi:hypothetical protein